jgi:hypothetical protein
MDDGGDSGSSTLRVAAVCRAPEGGMGSDYSSIKGKEGPATDAETAVMIEGFEGEDKGETTGQGRYKRRTNKDEAGGIEEDGNREEE